MPSPSSRQFLIYVKAVIRRGANVLITKRVRTPAAGIWHIPGGKVESGENIFRAAEREIREELGLKIRSLRVLDAVAMRSRKFLIYVECFVEGPPTIRLNRREVSAARWVPSIILASKIPDDDPLPRSVRKFLHGIARGSWRTAAVVDAFLIRQGKIAVFKRSEDVGVYRGKWQTIAGHIQPDVDPLDQAYVELREEIGLRPREVKLLTSIGPILRVDRTLKRAWVIFAYLFSTRRSRFQLDWEHTAMRWIAARTFRRLDHTPGVPDILDRLLASRP